MKRYFVWTRDIERVIYETLSDQRKRLASNSDAIVRLFRMGAEGSEHYYSSMATMYEVGRNWKNINKSSVYRMLEGNQRLWEGVGLVFSSLELQQVMAAPSNSIIVPTFGIGGYRFEIIKPSDPGYKDSFSRLPGAA